MYKKRYASRKIRGKLRVCRYLSANKKLKQHVPRTVSFSRANLEMMMDRYDIVYVKPDVGSLGMDIFMLKRAESGYGLYEIVKKKQVQTSFSSLTDVFERINNAKSSRLIIQKGISLDCVNDCPYDIRAMVQRKPRGSWICTGFMVKVGARHKIVTNYHQGGMIYTIKKLGKQQGIAESETARRVRKLTRTALSISRTLSKKQSGMHEMGIDFAYDKQKHLWVLEVNSNHPQFHPLKQLDRRAYNKMKRFAASYGRYDAK
ncbi:YheC/YheD family protein [Paenibacillus alkaliterrae]|uniref:YheC/YheD family protein n=1 Tax=Paenibacillus alkaliterrae TaxID=320909 RepID=UPI00228655D9